MPVKEHPLAYLPEALRTQNNLATHNPAFTVQQLVRVYGIEDGYTDEFAWLEDGESVDEEIAEKLEAAYQESGEPDGFSRVGVRDGWESVQSFLTMEKAEKYRLENHHNLQPESRVYVDGGHRNEEREDIRKFFMGGEFEEFLAWRASK